MRVRHGAGIWELFLPRVAYKYDIIGAGGSRVLMKADPVARRTETPPNTASVVAQPDDHSWHDESWMQARAKRHAPRSNVGNNGTVAAAPIPPHGVAQSLELVLPPLATIFFAPIDCHSLATLAAMRRASSSYARRRQSDFNFCVEWLFSQVFIMARACNSAFSRGPLTTFPFISTPAG
jgi:hypothetical protein